MMTLQYAYIHANGIKIHYVTAGQGPLVILLHGFPEFWYAWRHQIPALAEHFRVVAPDLRGYGDTERPLDVADYHPDRLAGDIIGLIRELGYEKAHIVGHDWGGAIAWKIALDQPDTLDHLAVLNCPHPYLFKKALRSNWSQMRRSWYLLLFQLPYLPELIFKMNPKRFVKGVLRGNSPTTFTKGDIAQYLKKLEEPGAITAALNYYRAAFRKAPRKGKEEPKHQKIAAPTLLIWGEGDKVLGKELTYGMEPLFSGSFRIHYIPQCSHWVNEEQPDQVNRLLLEFLQAN